MLEAMTTPFDLVQPRRVLFGRERIRGIGDVVREHGNRCWVVTGSRPERASVVSDALVRAQVPHEIWCASGEPTFDSVRDAAEAARAFAPDVVVAMGGGSVIDTAKAVAMLLTNGGDPLDYAEVVGDGKPVTRVSIPMIAIPTTAGTGTEATRNAVLKHTEKLVKVSLRSRWMMPEVVILDPFAMRGVPAHVAAASGMDALCQLIEAFVSCRANVWTDALCREGIPMAAEALPKVCRDPEDQDARAGMLLAACWSGVALANAGLGAVHGFAAVAGGVSDVPHGLICARLLALVCRANIEALERIPDSSKGLDKYRELAVLLTGNPHAKPLDGVAIIEELRDRLPLATGGIMATVPVEQVVSGAQRASSMKGNPVVLPGEVLTAIWSDYAGSFSAACSG